MKNVKDAEEKPHKNPQDDPSTRDEQPPLGRDFPKTDQTFLEQTRDERASQIRGTGDMPAPVHGATRPVESSGFVTADVPNLDADGKEINPFTGPPLRVRATRMGYYGDVRRRTGDVFTISHSSLFSKKWMETVAGSTPEKVTTGREALRKQHDEVLSGRSTGDAKVIE
jgi:hypothetical protein